VVFPQTPRETDVDLFLNNGWIRINNDVYARDGVTIRHGRTDESSRAAPSTCQLTINNRSGNYSPRNPTGLYYGSIGRNTPLQLAVVKDRDLFTRTALSSWGSTDTGTAWNITEGFGGSVLPSDWNVASGKGTMSVPAVGHRMSYLPSRLYRDVDVTVTVSLAFTDVLGGDLAAGNIALRGLDVDNYYLIFLLIHADETITIYLYKQVGGSFTYLETSGIIPGLTHSSAQALQVRARIVGETLLAKAWPAAVAEPWGWDVITNDTDLPDPGWVGMRSEILSGNTNTTPVVFSYDNLRVSVPRFTGEVSAWPQRWDISGNDVYVPIEAAGVKRRLGQGTLPVKSAMLRDTLALPNPPVAYWPCEEGKDGRSFTSAIGGPSMFLDGTADLAANTSFVAAKPLPTMDIGTWRGRVPTYTAVGGSATLTFLMNFPSSEPSGSDSLPIITLLTTGSAPQWEIKYKTGGLLSIEVWTPSGTNLYASSSVGFGLLDTSRLWTLILTQNGANVDWQLIALTPNVTFSTTFTGTAPGLTLGAVTTVIVDQFKVFKGVSLGHIMVRTGSTNIFDHENGLNAYRNETAGTRMLRLNTDEGYTFNWRGAQTGGDFSVGTALVGPQKVKTFLELVEEAAEVDMGSLYDSRAYPTLEYRPRSHAYNQDPALTLDYIAGQVTSLEPIDDDQQTRNDIIVSREDGGSFELFLSSGRMSVLDTDQGGAGIYSDSVTLNANLDDQLRDIAGWRLAQGTVDEPRYPLIGINLANPNTVALDNVAMSVYIDDQIIINNPKVGQTPDAIRQLVRGYTENINVFEHTIEFNCTPAATYRLLQADTAGIRKADSATSTLASGVTSTATSLSVAFTGARWTTSGGDMPLDLEMGGERISVTAVSGTTSPQTFTVTRSVNSVVKAQTAGTPIRLFRPARVGL
jgi:hypothetical protein